MKGIDWLKMNVMENARTSAYWLRWVRSRCRRVTAKMAIDEQRSLCTSQSINSTACLIRSVKGYGRAAGARHLVTAGDSSYIAYVEAVLAVGDVDEIDRMTMSDGAI